MKTLLEAFIPENETECLAILEADIAKGNLPDLETIKNLWVEPMGYGDMHAYNLHGILDEILKRLPIDHLKSLVAQTYKHWATDEIKTALNEIIEEAEPTLCPI